MTRIETVEDDSDVVVERLFDDPQTLCLRLDRGEEREPHRHPGKTIVLFVVQGCLELSLDDEMHTVERGQVVRFSGEREISPRATEDTTALLVFAEDK